MRHVPRGQPVEFEADVPEGEPRRGTGRVSERVYTSRRGSVRLPAVRGEVLVALLSLHLGLVFANVGNAPSSLPPRLEPPIKRFFKSLEREFRATLHRWGLRRRAWWLRRQAAQVDLARLANRLPSELSLRVVISALEGSVEQLDAALDSLRRQAFQNWRLSIVATEALRDAAGSRLAELGLPIDRVEWVTLRGGETSLAAGLRAALAAVPESHAVVLDADQVLEDDALLWFAATVARRRSAEWTYGDEISFGESGAPVEFHYKPDFSWQYLWCRLFTGRVGCFAVPLLRRVAAESSGGRELDGWCDLSLRMAEAASPGGIVHVPQILSGAPALAPTGRRTKERGERERQAVLQALARRGVSGDVSLYPTDFRLREIRLSPRTTPRVSIVIPNKDAGEMLKSCITAARAQTRYANYEIVVIDHESTEPALLKYLDEETSAGRLKVVPFVGPFNFSEMNNRAIATVDGEWIVLLNNDVDGFSDGWLEQLVAIGEMEKRHGAVATLLYYPDGTIQHGGIFFGLGKMGRHAHVDLPHDALGYDSRLRAFQELSAATAALLMVRREAFERIGGFDPKYPSDFNDVDLCLRLADAGYQIVYAPSVTACHYSAKTRKRRDRWHRSIMLRQWGDRLRRDRFYHPYLSSQVFGLDELNAEWQARKRVALAAEFGD